MSKKEFDFNNAQQGAVVKPPSGKTRITIRLDSDILNWFRNKVHEAGGGNYQTLINEALREYVRHQDSIFEETLRKVIREELQTIGR
ncbi:MAG: BrnA antitoxin family protein [Anaerolineales bacterium]